MTEVNSLAMKKDRKDEISHCYILGLYEILDRVTKTYPKVLMEGRSSGEQDLIRECYIMFRRIRPVIILICAPMAMDG